MALTTVFQNPNKPDIGSRLILGHDFSVVNGNRIKQKLIDAQAAHLLISDFFVKQNM